MFTALWLGIAAAAAAQVPPASFGPDGSQLVRAVQNCQSVKDNAARLACYDRAAGALVSATTRGEVAIVDRNQVRQVRRSLFGFSVPRLPFFSGSTNREADEEPKLILSTLGSFRPIGNGFFRFTLAEPESTWESTEASSVYEPRSGSKVTIKRGVMSSYFAEIDGRWVRVRRVH